MADFSFFDLEFNTNTDASPSWISTALSAGGAGGANELRFCASGAGSLVTAANWPLFILPLSVQVVPEVWAINTDNGTAVTGYIIPTTAPSGGVVPNSRVARWGWSQDGTFTSQPTFTCYTDSTLTNPSPGTQPPGAHNDTITNGSASDTGSTSYVKATAFGRGVTNAGAQQTPAAGSLVTPVSATDGKAGAATPADHSWIATHWQSLQGSIQYIQNGQIPTWTTHTGNPLITYFWYLNFCLFAGPAMAVGNQITFNFAFQYTYS